MAATGARIRVPVAVVCRVLRLSPQGYYKWLNEPVSKRDYDDAHAINALHEIHEDDPTLGYRFLADELADAGITASENRVHRLCWIAGLRATHAGRRGKAGKPGPRVHDDLLAYEDKHVARLPWAHGVGQVRHPRGGLRADRLQGQAARVHALEQADPGAEQHG